MTTKHFHRAKAFLFDLLCFITFLLLFLKFLAKKVSAFWHEMQQLF